MHLFPPLESDISAMLEEIPRLIDRIFPMPRRFRAGLPRDVAELSQLLTSSRGSRSESYLGKPPLLSAYLRYFLPWNLYRLCRLIPALSLRLTAGDALTDLGSGPLTFPIALWIARPDLRGIPLEFRCLDQTGLVLEAGKKLFYALAGDASLWHIKTIRAPLDAPVKGPKAALVSAVTVFNEQYWDLSRYELTASAGKHARVLTALTAESGSVLIVEPGIPRSGEVISVLRKALLEYGYAPRLPCPHQELCPFPGGGKAKWCHFAFDTRQAPQALLNLSAAARLPKERATLSFLLAGRSQEKPALQKSFFQSPFPIRIISDSFPVSSERRQYGRYGCSCQGIILVTGTQEDMANRESGALLLYKPASREARDPKSGALLVNLLSCTPL